MKRSPRETGAKRGFTLIELLVVVLIIAMLAAIAVPNINMVSVRAKVARAKNDMRVLATGLEAYRVDNQAYPLVFPAPEDILLGGAWLLKPVTTPVAYLSILPHDPFLPPVPDPIIGDRKTYRFNSYPFPTMAEPHREAKVYALASHGPDLENSTGGIYEGYSPELFFGGAPRFADWALYDPTNGINSRGDIFRASDHQFD